MHAAGGLQTPIVIVLNDNGMSISPNVGALSRYFTRIRLNPRLWHAREGVEDRLTRLPLGLGRRIERLGPEIKAAIKAYWAPGLFFEELDLAYMGVIDGHDVHALREALTEAFAADRPVVVHVHTVKGKGFGPAEEGGLESMEEWHAAKPNSIVNGKPAAAKPKPVPVTETDSPEGIERLERPPAAGSPPQYTKVFADAIVAEAERDPRVIGITAAMAGGTGLQKLADEAPEQYYDVGIAEQNAVLLACGLALEGAKPVCAIYSTFLQRAYDQIIHDVCLQSLDVTFAIDELVITSDHSAYALTRSNGTQTVLATGDQTAESNREIFLFRRTDAGWKIARKPLLQQRAVWQPIFDATYAPLNSGPDRTPFAPSEPIGWTIGGRAYRYDKTAHTELLFDQSRTHFTEPVRERWTLDDRYAYDQKVSDPPPAGPSQPMGRSERANKTVR